MARSVFALFMFTPSGSQKN